MEANSPQDNHIMYDPIPTDEAYTESAESLLRFALETRDAEAARYITQQMDDDPALEAQLDDILHDALDNQPDAVYFLVRTHLNAKSQSEKSENGATTTAEYSILKDEAIDSWLTRLQAAAVCSLKVAINDSDVDTLASWLKLIVREPGAYQLGDVLQEGILAAQTRAHSDGALGYQLLMVAVKKAPGSLDMLLDDPDLVAPLPDPIGSALRKFDPEAIKALYNQGTRGLYLVILGRAARAAAANPNSPAAQAFSLEVIDQLWAIYAEDVVINLPERYQPAHLIDLLLTDGFTWLPTNALVKLLSLILSHPTDKRFSHRANDIIRQVVERDSGALSAALIAGGFPPDTVLNIVGASISDGALTQQQMVNTYLRILDARGWAKTMSSMVEQVTRAVQQSPALTMPPERFVKILQFAAEHRIEPIVRLITKRILYDLERIENEQELSSQFAKLAEQVTWNPGTRAYVYQWWRDFAQLQPLPRLQQLEKALEGKKGLEEARGVIHTMLALRKIFAKRSLEDFADAVNTAYLILSLLSESFDPVPKHPFTVDQATVRLELDAREEELTPDARRVLAKNLKELGNVIVEMSENRTRATLIRREDDVERGLMTGEHQPHSAIDMLKWLSGYLDGAQDDEDTEA